MSQAQPEYLKFICCSPQSIPAFPTLTDPAGALREPLTHSTPGFNFLQLPTEQINLPEQTNLPISPLQDTEQVSVLTCGDKLSLVSAALATSFSVREF